MYRKWISGRDNGTSGLKVLLALANADIGGGMEEEARVYNNFRHVDSKAYSPVMTRK